MSKSAILDATLLIIKNDGLRQVKYQTVAELAGVANSAVAYYFGDIDTLIQQAFRHHFEKYAEVMVEVRGLGQYVLSQFELSSMKQADKRQAFIQQYCQAFTQLFATKDAATLEYMLLDRIFRNETLNNKPLYRILKVQDQLDIDAVTTLFQQLAVPQAELEAIQFMSLLWYLAEKLVQEDYSQQQKLQTQQQLQFALQKILAVDRD